MNVAYIIPIFNIFLELEFVQFNFSILPLKKKVNTISDTGTAFQA